MEAEATIKRKGSIIQPQPAHPSTILTHAPASIARQQSEHARRKSITDPSVVLAMRPASAAPSPATSAAHSRRPSFAQQLRPATAITHGVAHASGGTTPNSTTPSPDSSRQSSRRGSLKMQLQVATGRSSPVMPDQPASAQSALARKDRLIAPGSRGQIGGVHHPASTAHSSTSMKRGHHTRNRSHLPLHTPTPGSAHLSHSNTPKTTAPNTPLPISPHLSSINQHVRTPTAFTHAPGSTQLSFNSSDYSLLLNTPLELDEQGHRRAYDTKKREKLERSASFSSLSDAKVPKWIARHVRKNTKAEIDFKCTKLEHEKSVLMKELQASKLMISDLRYAAFKQEVQMERKVLLHQNLQEAAERNLEAISIKYMHKRQACNAYRFILLHTALTAFAKSWQVKKKMKVLHEEIRSLVDMLEQRKRRTESSSETGGTIPQANLGDLGTLLPQSETDAFIDLTTRLWSGKVRSLSMIKSDILVENLLDGLDSLRTGLTNTLDLAKTHESTSDSIFKRNRELSQENFTMKQDLQLLVEQRDDLWKQPGLLGKILTRMQQEEAERKKNEAHEKERLRKEEELAAVLAPKDTISTNSPAASSSLSTHSSPIQSARSRRPMSARRTAPIPTTTTHRSEEEKTQHAPSSSLVAYPPSAPSTATVPRISPAIPHRPIVYYVPSRTHLAKPARSSPHAPRSSIARVALSAAGVAYHHAPKELRVKREVLPVIVPPPPPPPQPVPTEDDDAPSKPDIPHYMQPLHWRPPPKVVHAPKPPPPPLQPHETDEMLIGWHDYDDEEEYLGQTYSNQPYSSQSMVPFTPAPPSSSRHPPPPSVSSSSRGRFQHGLQRFRAAVDKVIAQGRHRYDSIKDSMREYKQMDLTNMYLDPDVD